MSTGAIPAAATGCTLGACSSIAQPRCARCQRTGDGNGEWSEWNPDKGLWTTNTSSLRQYDAAYRSIVSDGKPNSFTKENPDPHRFICAGCAENLWMNEKDGTVARSGDARFGNAPVPADTEQDKKFVANGASAGQQSESQRQKYLSDFQEECVVPLFLDASNASVQARKNRRVIYDKTSKQLTMQRATIRFIASDNHAEVMEPVVLDVCCKTWAIVHELTYQNPKLLTDSATVDARLRGNTAAELWGSLWTKPTKVQIQDNLPFYKWSDAKKTGAGVYTVMDATVIDDVDFTHPRYIVMNVQLGETTDEVKTCPIGFSRAMFKDVDAQQSRQMPAKSNIEKPLRSAAKSLFGFFQKEIVCYSISGLEIDLILTSPATDRFCAAKELIRAWKKAVPFSITHIFIQADKSKDEPLHRALISEGFIATEASITGLNKDTNAYSINVFGDLANEVELSWYVFSTRA